MLKLRFISEPAQVRSASVVQSVHLAWPAQAWRIIGTTWYVKTRHPGLPRSRPRIAGIETKPRNGFKLRLSMDDGLQIDLSDE
jgi:hypothetical protein